MEDYGVSKQFLNLKELKKGASEGLKRQALIMYINPFSVKNQDTINLLLKTSEMVLTTVDKIERTFVQLKIVSFLISILN